MANKPYQPMSDPPDGNTDSPQGGEAPYQVTLDKSNPDIAEAFAECKEGDVYKVVKDDENEIVLEKQPEMSETETYPEEPPMDEETPADGGEEDGGFKSDKPGIALLIAKKRKQ